MLTNLLKRVAPFGLVKAADYRAVLSNLGVPRGRAWRWALSNRKLGALGECRAALLPAGSLARLDYLVDVGANSGEWTRAVLELASPKKVVVVEPDPRMRGHMERLAAARAEVTFFPVVAGPAAGTMDFHMTSNPAAAASSVMTPIESVNKYYGFGFDIGQTIRVEVKTLDEMTAGLPEISLLKIDVQGFEASVLAGAVETLKRTKLIVIEVCFYPHYEGDMLFAGLHDLLGGAGFELINMSEPWVAGGRAMWADAVYRRVDARPAVEN